MAYCVNCGEPLNGSERFCQRCGKPVLLRDNQGGSARNEIWEGSLHKCPNCGAAVGGFDAYCPACGIELRDKSAANSVAELAKQLDKIEAERPAKYGKKRRRKMTSRDMLDEYDERTISLIRTFPIPNTVEDIQEFLILATSNVDAKSYSFDGNPRQRAISDAWLSKCDQAVKKAEMAFGGSNRADGMHRLMEGIRDNIKQEKKKGVVRTALWIIIPILIALIASLITMVMRPGQEAAERARLEQIEASIEKDLGEGEYLRALLSADSLVASEYVSDEMQREWGVQREYWMNRVVEEAAEKGVDLSARAEQLEEEHDIESLSSYGRFQRNADTFNEEIEKA